MVGWVGGVVGVVGCGGGGRGGRSGRDGGGGCHSAESGGDGCIAGTYYLFLSCDEYLDTRTHGSHFSGCEVVSGIRSMFNVSSRRVYYTQKFFLLLIIKRMLSKLLREIEQHT